MRINIEPTVLDLPRGLRLVHMRQRASASGIFGICVRAGSADEGDGEHGLAHFVEHTIFKGTSRRSSWHIINRMEAVGGELNAYTTKEETVVYSVFPSGNASRAIELIADLATASRFPEKELTKEREVVLDEISSYLDTPSEAVFDIFEDLMFAGTPLGHNILGTEESVRRLGSDDCRRFLATYYTADNLVAFYSGPQSPEVIATLVSRYFEALPATAARGPRATSAATARSFAQERSIGSHQAHTVMGIATEGMFSQERYAVALLGNIVGGPGMNSLLNVALRERRGLVYSVEASTAQFSGCGSMDIYFGCDEADNRRCINLCSGVFRHIADGSYLTPTRLARAKKQYLGQLAIASENRENRIMGAARATLFRGHPTSAAETADAIASVEASELAALAEKFSTPSILTLKP